MNRFSLSVLLFLGLFVIAPSSFAQATRTWVSGVGNDADPCSRTAPCKTWAGAISKTASGGEIDALDPGGFGTVTITKPITLDGGAGQVASILASGTNGIIINTAGIVNVRNISISGWGVTLGTNGIRVLAGAQVTVENCVIEGFSQKGIDVAAAVNTSITIRNVRVNAAATGISLANTAGSAFGTIVNSTITNASVAGVVVNNGIVNIETSMLANNPGTALLPTAGVIRISNSDLFNDGIGSGAGAGTIVSAGNNRKAGNGSGASDPTITAF